MSVLINFLQRLQTYSPQVCIESGEHSHTYDELLQEMRRWEIQLDALNVQPGSVIGVRGDYSLHSIAALLALYSRKAIAALLPRDSNSADYMQDACVEALFEFNTQGSHGWHVLGRRMEHPLLEQLRDLGEAGVIMFTSGSTGRPKAALQSAERFLKKYVRSGRRFRTLAFLLFDHVAGQDTLFYTLSSGGTLILTDHRDPASIVSLIDAHKVEVLPTSPSFLRMLCAANLDRTHNLSSLRIITYGSEPMDSSTLVRLNERFPSAQIIQKYGTTETGSPRTVSRGNDSLWVKIKNDGVETKVIDNVLWLRSESTMLGYLNATSALDREGWYCTGDVVDIDGDWIRFRGRVCDVVNVGGEKVAPVEVEQSILELEFVRDVLVSGEPHPLLGQVVTARVLLADAAQDQKQAAKRIRAHCRMRLASYKVPVRMEFVTEGLANDRQKARRMAGADRKLPAAADP